MYTSEFEAYYKRQIEWSKLTFGPHTRTAGIVNHIRKELVEVQADPYDLKEWVDIITLAMDGYWRHGGTYDGLLNDLQDKQDINFGRKWPDWRTLGDDQAIEHDRSEPGEHQEVLDAIEQCNTGEET